MPIHKLIPAHPLREDVEKVSIRETPSDKIQCCPYWGCRLDKTAIAFSRTHAQHIPKRRRRTIKPEVPMRGPLLRTLAFILHRPPALTGCVGSAMDFGLARCNTITGAFTNPGGGNAGPEMRQSPTAGGRCTAGFWPRSRLPGGPGGEMGPKSAERQKERREKGAGRHGREMCYNRSQL